MPASARAADAGAGTGLLVTVVARECPTYQDVTANLARNNIMESLQDLGADTLYSSGEPINPIKEAEGQPNCKPIPGWQFTLGSGIQEKASKGPWGALSIVTGAESPTVTTKVSTPLLGWDGEPIKGQSLRGATTFELNQAQAERSAGHYLWIQGGTTTDPVLFDDPRFEGEYGFAALRCSIDNLNGDNVETIDFPPGPRTPSVTPTTSRRRRARARSSSARRSKGRAPRRRPSASAATSPTTPAAPSNSRPPPEAPGEMTFFRGETRPGEAPWTVDEEVPEGWKLTGLHCESGREPGDDRPRDGLGLDRPRRRRHGHLHLRRRAQTAERNPAPAQGDPGRDRHLRLQGVGRRRIDGEIGADRDERRKACPAYAKPMVLDPGRYRILEHSPKDPKGVWRAVGASCDGDGRGAGGEVEVSVEASKGALCTFTNRLVYPGRITIRKETIGGIGSAGFQITDPAYPTLERNQIAVVDKERTPVLARGDSTRGLPFGTYVIQESVAQATDPAGWSLIEVVCDGRAVPFEQGRATLRLTRHDPKVKCRFVNLYTPTAEPTPPNPTPPGPGPQPGEAVEIAVEKTLVRSGSGPVPTDALPDRGQEPLRRERLRGRRHRRTRPRAGDHLGRTLGGRHLHTCGAVRVHLRIDRALR